MEIQHTACLGGGVIGASWAALFLASGRSVALFDPDPNVERKVCQYVENAWSTLGALGLTENGNPDAITFHSSAAAAVADAGFVQENVPERLQIKHATFAEIEPALSKGAIVASSASGLTLGQMQPGWSDPSHFVLGHPFNPPHLIPLVEVMGNEKTSDGVVDAAQAFYESVGKTTIRVNKEVPGHVANRLQAALWREAIHLVVSGVASVEDVDKAVWAGPGVRWAAMGPTMLFNLGAGKGGLKAFCDHFTDTFNGWWDDLGQVYLTDDVAQQLTEGVMAEAAGKTQAELSEQRDALILAMQKSIAELR
ncbi:MULTISPECIES: 3-hydroxyacyl-CoA dehydrogenase NAD-binding domain-containing protein [unclassified Ruegeria]|uniref:3-hydroxyacyl-CoA dehydrogenase NAD-binding domain-containing protein n=1 Tax=unclassified Ruegeria TaxID=2625375 RepID=UPI00148763F4|nr:MULTISPECIES: 3-hydroxyacyl-CoA dehydrogenase NAD-binding domain-containing protein [unclassified Ruegeria]NOD48599.1 3-hydroxyacyl-CoA dehydrogenase [Ruegeria sp. HKCCD5849]NOD52099.1 3-hydroxyacyl-CoA dehydrogenase [Ruegeria sp. HKCCD5851]NOD66757.1 3-hydroxyacyl-CoA dehydrogenase [Ruegeria sp. HKCCD7303]NOD93960.1 3-hydroxyacyl-CoA dehydrogenase [Ruegeria sp. HKCCD4884]NOE33761.1 3-hydroxyacyl-CoA dehydrogenase [Ruegeria sp. HKCCD7318]